MDLSALQNFLKDKRFHSILAIIKGFRNGLVYGAKIRFPHALVMTLLFRAGPFKDNFKAILKLTYEHSRNLGIFVLLYKSLMAIQAKIAGLEQSHHSFVAGLIGGYFIWGNYTSVNYQIVLYLFARILIGLVKLFAKKHQIVAPNQTYPVFAAIVWGIVMWLFRWEGDTLHPSLHASMHYLYNDSNHWNSLRNWIWHNK